MQSVHEDESKIIFTAIAAWMRRLEAKLVSESA